MNSNLVKKHFDNMCNIYDNIAFNSSLGLKYMSKIETNFLLRSIKNRKGKCLDVGAGTGRISSLLAEKFDVTAIDLSLKMMSIAKRKIKSKSIKFMAVDVNKPLKFQDNTFDLIVCIRVLKYVKNWRYVLKEFNRILKDKGEVIIEFANLYSVQFFGLYSAKYFLFDLREVEKELKKSGFLILSYQNGLRIPLPVYNQINNKEILRIFIKFEKLIAKILPYHLFAKNVVYHIKKV